MTIFKKHSDGKKSNVIKITSKKSKNCGAEIVDIEKKINEAIEKRLGSFVKEMQAIKTKQKKLEEIQKSRSLLGFTKKKKNKKSKHTPSSPTKKK